MNRGETLNKKNIAVAIAMIALASCSVFAILELSGVTNVGVFAASKTKVVRNVGRFRLIGVEVFNDSACTIQTTSIDWGFVDPATTYNYTYYIKNIGNKNITITQVASNYVPAMISNFITPSWNYTTGTIILTKSAIPVIFRLAISGDIDTMIFNNFDAFSYDLTVTATAV